MTEGLSLTIRGVCATAAVREGKLGAFLTASFLSLSLGLSVKRESCPSPPEGATRDSFMATPV